MNLNTSPLTFANPLNSAFMSDTSDVRASLTALLGQNLSELPVAEVAVIVRTRIVELEPALDTGKSFGMTELEHGMLVALLAQLTGRPDGALTLH